MCRLLPKPTSSPTYSTVQKKRGVELLLRVQKRARHSFFMLIQFTGSGIWLFVYGLKLGIGSSRGLTFVWWNERIPIVTIIYNMSNAFDFANRFRIPVWFCYRYFLLYHTADCPRQHHSAASMCVGFTKRCWLSTFSVCAQYALALYGITIMP